jgi:adenosine 3'-phospho 5'-phosphosulfate transporter B3
MLVASVVHKKIFTSLEYMCALAVCTGLVLFAAADWQYTPSFHPIGLLLVTLSVCADAILPNAQERLFQLGSSRLEVTFFTNLLTLGAMTITTYLSGDLVGLAVFASNNNHHHHLLVYMSMYTAVAYFAVSMHMSVVKRFGGVAAVVLATARKGMTLILSFLLFPKAFSWFYVCGAFLVLGGLLASSLSKKNKVDEKMLDEEEGVQLISSQSKEEETASPRNGKSLLERGSEIVTPRPAHHVHQQ